VTPSSDRTLSTSPLHVKAAFEPGTDASSTQGCFPIARHPATIGCCSRKDFADASNA